MAHSVLLLATLLLAAFVAGNARAADTSDYRLVALEPTYLDRADEVPPWHWVVAQREPTLAPPAGVMPGDTPGRMIPDRGVPGSVTPGGMMPSMGPGGEEAWSPEDGPSPWCPEDAAPRRPGFFQLPEQRFRGPGEPLLRESWDYRPIHVDAFTGLVVGTPLIENWVGQSAGVLWGFRLGWDFDPYFGLETKVAAASIDLYDRQLRAQSVASMTNRNNDMIFWDLDFLYYPWGDSRWRPYASIGFGLAEVDFQDQLGNYWQNTGFALPIGIGLKYRRGDFLAFRFDLNYTLVTGAGQSIETTHYFQMMLGGELHFGGLRRAYYPWNPGREYW